MRFKIRDKITLCFGNKWTESWSKVSWTLFTKFSFFMLHYLSGLPALPEQHGAAMFLSATSHILLCREGLPPAFPGAASPMLHYQVNPPLTYPWFSVLHEGLCDKIVPISYGLHLFACSAVCSLVYLCNKYIWLITKEKHLCCLK